MDRDEDLHNEDDLHAAEARSAADRTARASDRAADREVERGVTDEPRRHAEHSDSPTLGDQVGEAAGGIGGVLAGAAIGSMGGPIGTVIGGIAGAIGGWWTGRAISEAASSFSHADDEEFRSDYETRDAQAPSTPNRSYERVRPAYQLGYLASRNPEYAGRSFEDIEEHLERGWTTNEATQGGDWSNMRDYARTAYVRGAASQSSLSGDGSARPSPASTASEGSTAPTTSFAGDAPTRDDVQTPSQTRNPMSQSNANDDAAERLASPKGSSFTRQGDVPLNSSATDSAGVSRAPDSAERAAGESGALRGGEPNRGASFTDPVAGEGVENIASSGSAPRGGEGTLNDAPEKQDQKPGQY